MTREGGAAHRHPVAHFVTAEREHVFEDMVALSRHSTLHVNH